MRRACIIAFVLALSVSVFAAEPHVNDLQVNDKDYLEITGTRKAFSVVAQKAHADELEVLFSQRGLACRRQANALPNEDALRFEESADRAAVQEVLESYKQAKGS